MKHKKMILTRLKTGIMALMVLAGVFAGSMWAGEISEASGASIPADAVYYDGHCYKVYNDSLGWEKAKEYCENLNGHLATVTSAGEKEIVEELVTEASGGSDVLNDDCTDYFLGGYKEDDTWKWVTGEAWDYTNWNKNEPDNAEGGQVYLRMVYAPSYSWKWGWDDIESTHSCYGFVCEWDRKKCGDNLYWELEKGSLSITGTGPMWNWNSQEEIPWYEDCDEIKQVYIGDGATSIGNHAFSGCGNISAVHVPASVTSIGNYAFEDCSRLQDVGNGGFENCTGLTLIGNYAFCNCTGLSEISIPDNVTDIGFGAFSACESLEGIALGEKVSKIGVDAFAGDWALEEIYFRGSVPTFSESDDVPESVEPFGSQTSMTVYIPEGNTSWASETLKTYGAEKIRWIKYDPDSEKGQSLDLGSDIWAFSNRPDAFGDISEGYYISQSDYNRLNSSLENVDKYKILLGIVTEDLSVSPRDIHPAYSLNVGGDFSYDPYGLFGNGYEANKCYSEWGGSCYGMSSWVYLTYSDILSVSDISNEEMLKKIAMSPKVESAINYYHSQSQLTGVQNAADEFMAKKQSEQLEELENLALQTELKKEPVLIGFERYAEHYEDGIGKESSHGEHMVIGYGLESGHWELTVNDVTENYTRRVLIYDCACPAGGENYYLYYNENGVWCIPGNKMLSTRDGFELTKGNNARLNLVTTDSELINAVDYKTGKVSGKIQAAAREASSRVETGSDASYEVSWNGESAKISGFTVTDNTSNEKINVIAEANVTSDGDAGSAMATAFLPEADSYTVMTDDDTMQYRFQSGNYLIDAAIGSSGKMTFGTSGSVSIEGNQKSDYRILMTANDGCSSLSWDTVQISGKETSDIAVKLTEEGIAVNGDCLDNLTIGGINYEDENAVWLDASTDVEKILISDEKGQLVVSGDSDGDGTYDTVIAKSEKTEEKQEQKEPPVVKVSKITLSGISKQVAAGKKITLTAKVSPSNAKNTAVTWKSSNTKIATVSSSGVVLMKKGSGGKTVTITATAKDGSGVKATYKIKSMKGVVKKISISGSKSVKAGKSIKLRAKVTATKKANKKLKWTSSNTKYAKVSSSGKVKTYKAGKGKKVAITAAATDGSGKKKKVTIRIK